MWKGIAPKRPIATLEDLSAPMARRVHELIEDALNYVHWTLEWPKFVQIVRSIEQGTFLADMKAFACRQSGS